MSKKIKDIIIQQDNKHLIIIKEFIYLNSNIKILIIIKVYKILI